MKSNRRILALLVCLLLVCIASSASAATKKVSKTFTEVPTLRFTDAPSHGTASGEMNDVTISASIPGFLNLYIVDDDGSILLTLAKNMEIPSKTTTFDFYAVDDNGELIAPGEYQFSADMVSQFGVESKVVTRMTKILESEDKETAAKAAANRKSTSSSSQTAKTDDQKETASTSSSSSSSSSSKPKATPVPEKLEYAAGESKMGDEGLLVGVGVSDVAVQTDAGYWGLTASATDAELWAAITRKMVGVDVGESESAYIYDSPESGREKIGTVSGISQGLNVITERDDGWALVETFRNEDGAFIRGYIKSDKLRPVDPNVNFGIVIDKATQTLIVLKDGVRVGSCKVTTGLATSKYPHRETPAGEFITVTRRGSYEYYGMGYYTKYTIRINGNYYLAEIPTTKKNGSKFVEDLESALGGKATRGTICIAHDASTDGGINAEWIWDMTDENKRVKVLIFDDKPRTDVPVSAK
ncbi:MAG: L,D-transpeptidase [Clostridia bacterium]|nr:L,D-transpeptidase [Clostridia bacterium]